jgi:hypothetical protein
MIVVGLLAAFAAGEQGKIHNTCIDSAPTMLQHAPESVRVILKTRT